MPRARLKLSVKRSRTGLPFRGRTCSVRRRLFAAPNTRAANKCAPGTTADERPLRGPRPLCPNGLANQPCEQSRQLACVTPRQLTVAQQCRRSSKERRDIR